MPLNYKEIELILKEADITGSRIQSVSQNSFTSLTWELYSKNRGKYLYYTEIGTPEARLHILQEDKAQPKLKKLQRFIQFCRANVEGAIITKVEQLPFDRYVIWHAKKGIGGSEEIKIHIRLYSGSGANIIITDKNDKILDLLLRRPNRKEMSGLTLIPEHRTAPDKEYTVREYPKDTLFSTFIASHYKEEKNEKDEEKLYSAIIAKKTKELEKIQGSIQSSKETILNNKDYILLKEQADLLTSNKHLLTKGLESITVTNWKTGKEETIKLEKQLSPSENIQKFYNLYEKEKNTVKNATEEIERLELLYKNTEEKYNKILLKTEDEDKYIEKLRKFLEKNTNTEPTHTGPGIHLSSNGFDIIAGRDAKENDELLRHYAKSQDTWVHTRDYPGGYVFIKYKKGKTIPLDVLLDAANIAVLYSKGKNDTSVSLYYTQVRYLRRAKDGKKGLVLPTQEKNLTIKPDKERLSRLFNN